MRFSSDSVDRIVSDRLLVEFGESVVSLPLTVDSGDVLCVGVPAPSPGTSRLDRLIPRMGPMLCLAWFFSVGLLTPGADTGNRPTLLSLRCEEPGPRGLGAGDVALLRLPPAFSSSARWRSSWCCLRLLSLVLMERGLWLSLVETEVERPAVDMRFSSLNMAVLWANKSRSRR